MEGEETIQSSVSLTYNFGDIIFGARDHDNINLRLIQDGPPRGGICESTGARIIDLGGIGKPTREGLEVTFPAGGARDLLRDRGECPGRDGREHLHLESKHGGAENSRSAMRCGGNKRRTMQKAKIRKKESGKMTGHATALLLHVGGPGESLSDGLTLTRQLGHLIYF